MPLTRRTALASAFAALSSPALAADPVPLPRVAPAGAGLDPARLEAVLEAGLAGSSLSVAVARGGALVAERYAPTYGPEQAREVASVGKSLVAVLIGMAIEDGRIRGLDQPAADFVPQWAGGPRAAITLRHLMSMTSGLDDRGLALRNVAGDQFALNAAAPLRDPPGTRWAYNTAVYHLLFHVLERAVGEPFPAYARRRLLGPLGMTHTTWLTNTGQGAAGPVTNYYTAIASTPDLLRFGTFVGRGGVWGGRRLVKADFLRTLTQPSQALNPSYGLLWWLNSQPGTTFSGQGAPALRFPGSPPDTVAALGAGGQAVMIVPSLDLVVVRQGMNPPESLLPTLLEGVVGAVRGPGPKAAPVR